MLDRRKEDSDAGSTVKQQSSRTFDEKKTRRQIAWRFGAFGMHFNHYFTPSVLNASNKNLLMDNEYFFTILG